MAFLLPDSLFDLGYLISSSLALERGFKPLTPWFFAFRLTLRLNYTTSFPGSPHCRWQIIGLLSLHNHLPLWSKVTSVYSLPADSFLLGGIVLSSKALLTSVFHIQPSRDSRQRRWHRRLRISLFPWMHQIYNHTRSSSLWEEFRN